LIHAVFSVYVRVRIAYRAVALRTVSVLYYHHRTPEYIRRDVHSLPRLPRHVSVILTLEEGGKRSDAKEKLISEVADIASWCASAGISRLSVYERSGVLKSNMELSHRKVSSKLRDWFGKFQAPDLHLHAPNLPVIHPSYYSAPGRQQEPHHGMSVMLISAEDGRESMVDLTKVLTQMAQRSKLTTADITTDVIDSELTNSVMTEPDLLISFAPFVDLQGYPPWQIRLTELYCEKDNQNGVEYQVFLNGLRKYAAATFKLGK
jgi:undecaprenyl pyrophosphate synthase